MTQKHKNILEYVGNDGEFLHSVDAYLQETYEDWQSADQASFTGGVYFPNRYMNPDCATWELLDYLHLTNGVVFPDHLPESYHNPFKLPWYEDDAILGGLVVLGVIFLLILSTLAGF